jgi:predicted nucleotidyltransferase
MEQQRRALTAYVDSVRDDPDVIAVVLVGSVARGRERADSDVDVYLVVSEERFARETGAGRFAWVERRGADYPGSYIDIKLASPAYLDAAAVRGDDPTRASFQGAEVVFARQDDIEPLVRRIPQLADDAWDERVRSYVAQARLYGGYFLPQGVEHGDPFLVRHAAVHLALAAARAALAKGHVLMQGPKYVSRLLRSVPTPDGFVDAWDRAVMEPGTATAEPLLNLLDEWLADGMDGDQALSIFIRDNELVWLRGGVPAEFS